MALQRPEISVVAATPAGGTRTMLFFHDGHFESSPLLRVGRISRRAGRRVGRQIGAREGQVRRAGVDPVQVQRGRWKLIQRGQGRPGGDLAGRLLSFRVCDDTAWQISSVEGSPRASFTGRKTAATGPSGVHGLREEVRRSIHGRPARRRAYRDFTGCGRTWRSQSLGRPATLEDVRAAGRSSRPKGRERPAWRRCRPCRSRRVDHADGSPRDLQRATGPSSANTTGTAGSGRPRRSARGTAGSGRSASSAATRSLGSPPPRSSCPRSFTAWGRSRAGWMPGSRRSGRAPPAIDPGKPLLMIVRMRNRRGVENAAPTEFLAGDVDGRRCAAGLAHGLLHGPASSRGPSKVGLPAEELRPRRTDRFDPGQGQVTAPGPFEAFDVMQFDLNEWFDVTRPGTYSVRITFATDSGLARERPTIGTSPSTIPRARRHDSVCGRSFAGTAPFVRRSSATRESG